MWFVFKLFLVSFISTIALFGALGSDNEWPGLIVSSVVWIWFIWSLSDRQKGNRHSDKENQKLIEELLRKMERRSY